MSNLIVLLSFFLLQAPVDSAMKYLYVREKTENRGPEIDRWNRYVGNPLGAPWCAAFASSMIRGVSDMKTGAARRFIKKHSIPASEVLKGREVPPGSLAIWAKGNSAQGHVEIVVSWKKDRGVTIGGNTAAGKGNQRDGDGVYKRNRRIEPFNYFRIVYFTPVEV